jgi:hypothetical protein
MDIMHHHQIAYIEGIVGMNICAMGLYLLTCMMELRLCFWASSRIVESARSIARAVPGLVSTYMRPPPHPLALLLLHSSNDELCGIATCAASLYPPEKELRI